MAGQKVDGESLHRLFEDHGVTFAGGVPTVWLGYVRYLQGAGVKPTTLNRVLIGGTACPRLPDGNAAGRIQSRSFAWLGHDGNQPDRDDLEATAQAHDLVES